MLEIIKCNFSDFVHTLSEPVTKKIIWDKYYKVKGESGKVPCQKGNGAARVASVFLLEQYALIREKKEIAKQCEYVFFQFFQYASDDTIEASIKKILSDTKGEFSYSDFWKAVEYIKKNYGKWLSDLEWTKEEKEFPYEEKYETFKLEKEQGLKDWNDILNYATEEGLDITIDEEILAVNPVIEEFFAIQENEMQENYNEFEQWELLDMHSGYETLERIRCKTVVAGELCKKMEQKIDAIERERWQQKLDAFKEILVDKQPLSGRLVLGDNEEKVKQAQDNFVSSGKFEYIIMLNDTSRGLKCKEGMAITTKNLYYKSMLSGGEIPVQDISHFEITGTVFGQSLAVYTLKGKKILVPCEVGKTEQLNYLRILEELVKILRNQQK